MLLNNKTFLISAYACEPNAGSEPGVGWNWSTELSKNNNVIVITRENNRDKIEKVYSKNKYPNLQFYYCDVPKKLAFWKRGQKGIHLYYCIWQLYCYKLAKKLTQRYDIDYCMSLTFGNIWMPTFMYKLPCKFVWGPLGGGEGVPKELWSHISFKQRIVEIMRKFNAYFPITNPWKNKACKEAILIIVRTRDTLACISDKYKYKCQLIIETGISTEDVIRFKRLDALYEGFTKNDFIICGKMVPYKMFDMAVDAFNKAKKYNNMCKLHIVGDGPMRNRILKMIDEYNLQNSIVYHGELSREDTLRIMASCKALLLTSAREGGSWVMFEAMLLKKPIICFDTSGMSVVLDKETAFMVPVCKYDDAVAKFASILETCNSYLCEKKGKMAYHKVINKYMWDSKIKEFLRELNTISTRY